eukprot:2721082-Amphidinium_carterae.1
MQYGGLISLTSGREYIIGFPLPSADSWQASTLSDLRGLLYGALEYGCHLASHLDRITAQKNMMKTQDPLVLIGRASAISSRQRLPKRGVGLNERDLSVSPLGC